MMHVEDFEAFLVQGRKLIAEAFKAENIENPDPHLFSCQQSIQAKQNEFFISSSI